MLVHDNVLYLCDIIFTHLFIYLFNLPGGMKMVRINEYSCILKHITWVMIPSSDVDDQCINF